MEKRIKITTCEPINHTYEYLEVEIDGKLYQVEIGDIKMGGEERRGVRIVCGFELLTDTHACNAVVLAPAR